MSNEGSNTGPSAREAACELPALTDIKELYNT